MKHGRHFSYLAAFLVTWVSGCGTPVDPDQEPTPAGAAPFIVSDAAFVGPSDVSGSAGLEPVVFVSLPPGTLSGGRTISIRVDRSGAVVSAALLDGGLDPVAVPAVEGDLRSTELIYCWDPGSAAKAACHRPDRSRKEQA